MAADAPEAMVGTALPIAALAGYVSRERKFQLVAARPFLSQEVSHER